MHHHSPLFPKLGIVLTLSSLLVNAAAVSFSSTHISFNEVELAGVAKGRSFHYGIGDFNGDGKWDFLVKDMHFNMDPIHFPDNQPKAPIILRAFDHQGKQLWTHCMGNGIPHGIWYAPVVVYDVDGDGKSEVYCRGVEGYATLTTKQGPIQPSEEDREFIYKLDPTTGTVIKKGPWVKMSATDQWLTNNRNNMCIAYLDGINPSIVAVRGTYKAMLASAYDKDLNVLWEWKSSDESDERYETSGAHTISAADVDGDGRDEVLIGSAVLDDNGKGLWAVSGHVDAAWVTDIDWSNPGLEVWLGEETYPQRSGLYDAKTGRALWNADVSSQGCGLVGDLDPGKPGLEISVGLSTDKIKVYYADGTLAAATPAEVRTKYTITWDKHNEMAGWFDGTAQQTSIDAEGIPGSGKANGQMVVDISGDWREELIIGDSDGKGVTIYTPNGSPQKNFRSPLLDRQYRQHLARGSRLAGYYIRPTLSYRINEGTVSASALSQPLAHAAQPLGAVYNRSTNTLQIYGLQTESRARVALYTLRGERIFATTLSGQATSALSLPSTMAPGIYLFTLGTGGVNACQRVTIYR